MPAEPTTIVLLDQLWSKLPLNTRQEVLQRLTLMVAQHVLHADDQKEASND